MLLANRSNVAIEGDVVSCLYFLHPRYNFSSAARALVFATLIVSQRHRIILAANEQEFGTQGHVLVVALAGYFSVGKPLQRR